MLGGPWSLRNYFGWAQERQSHASTIQQLRQYAPRVFIGVGTAINVIAIVVGTLLGKLLGDRIPTRTRDLTTEILGAVTLVGAASALVALWSDELVTQVPSGAPILIVLGSLLIGGLIGSGIDLEARLERWGVWLRNRMGEKEGSGFVTGFVTASLIFVIGPLAILGSISDGMGNGIDQLVLKSILDFFAALAFGSTFGWGVAFSALPVGIYQGLWTAAGFLLGQVLSELQIAAMTATGGILLFGIGLRLLQIKNIAIGNLLPALAIAPLLASLAASFA